MTLKKTFKWMGLAACAAVVFAGCGKKAAEPLVPAADDVALVCDYRNMRKSSVMKTLMDFAKTRLAALPEAERAEALKRIDAFEDGQGIGWAVLSCSLPEKFEPGKLPMPYPDIHLVLSRESGFGNPKTLDLDEASVTRVIKMIAENGSEADRQTLEDCTVEETTVAGIRAFRLAFSGNTRKKLDANVLNFSPCWSVLDGKLALMSSNEKALAKLIDLYRTGEGKSNDFNLSGKFMSLQLPKAGSIVCRYAPEDNLSGFPGGVEALRKCSGLVVDVGTSPDGESIVMSAALEVGNEELAGLIRDQINGFLAMGKMGVAMKPESRLTEEEKLGKKLLESVKVEGTTGISISLSVPGADVLQSMQLTAQRHVDTSE